KYQNGTFVLSIETLQQNRMVFQQSILDNDLTVMENLSIRNKLYKEAKSNHIDALIQKIGLTEFNIGMRTE
ncbi:MAG: hypothetical protein L0J85_11040, partial [Tetragenococcus koreensis]|nr:hypothetical protein [Tetragenococcus koreensis]MDN6409489.1 hypothetical protein [Tetragenococcus halophilus]